MATDRVVAVEGPSDAVMTLPLRYHLAVVLVGLNIAGTAVVSTFAYRTSRQSLQDQALRGIGAVADARQQQLFGVFGQRQDRMTAFLASVESLCAERAPSGGLGWEPECVRVALTGFRSAEHATAAELRYRARRLAASGKWSDPTNVVGTGELAEFGRDTDQLTMVVARGNLVLRARFPLSDIEPIFRDRSGLRANGEMFLGDPSGAFLTPLRVLDPVRSHGRGRESVARAVPHRA